MKPQIPNSRKAEELFKNLKDLLEELDKKKEDTILPELKVKEKQNEKDTPDSLRNGNY